MMPCRSITLPFFLALGWVCPADAVILLETGDPAQHVSSPGDNSGWQYEGKFGDFLGVPIALHFFITAKHIGGEVGDIFDFHGDSYTTIGFHDNPSNDLRIWEVDGAKPFPTFAPLSSGVADIGAAAAVFGRGTRRGDEVVVSGEPKGWKWGTADHAQRWGRNTVAGAVNDPTYGELLYCDFDNPGPAGESHLSDGDSGGGMFVLEGGLWRLAGIHLAVDGPFRTGPAGTPFNGALYDQGGLEYQDPPDWTSVAEQAENIPTRFYSSRISASLAWISGIAPEAGTFLAEGYEAWRRLYFTPAQIATPSATGPVGDFDADGIQNLLEFALNLDPTFSERVSMPSDDGLRGLPLVRIENVAGSERLTIEFVRRKSGSGSGLTYFAEFSSDVEDWQQVGTETITDLNPRWERVKIADSLTIGDSDRRFARLKVSLAE